MIEDVMGALELIPAAYSGKAYVMPGCFHSTFERRDGNRYPGLERCRKYCKKYRRMRKVVET